VRLKIHVLIGVVGILVDLTPNTRRPAYKAIHPIISDAQVLYVVSISLAKSVVSLLMSPACLVIMPRRKRANGTSHRAAYVAVELAKTVRGRTSTSSLGCALFCKPPASRAPWITTTPMSISC
jgi:hypothetical protein